jgi:hypothetical protein
MKCLTCGRSHLIRTESIMLCTEYCIYVHSINIVSFKAASYGLDGPGIESPKGRDLPHPFKPALGHTQPPVNGYRVIPGGKERPGRDIDYRPPHNVAVKERVKLFLYPTGPSLQVKE